MSRTSFLSVLGISAEPHLKIPKRVLLEDCQHHVEDHSRYDSSITFIQSTPCESAANICCLVTAGVRDNVSQLLNYSLNEKKRNFLETVELQIGLKNYDPQRDKRFSGTIRLPTVPRPNMTVWYVYKPLRRRISKNG